MTHGVDVVGVGNLSQETGEWMQHGKSSGVVVATRGTNTSVTLPQQKLEKRFLIRLECK